LDFPSPFGDPPRRNVKKENATKACDDSSKLYDHDNKLQCVDVDEALG